jgi:hypothetical protein
MDTIRPFVPVLVAIGVVLLAVGLVVSKLASFGKDMESVSRSPRKR